MQKSVMDAHFFDLLITENKDFLDRGGELLRLFGQKATNFYSSMWIFDIEM